MDELTRYIVTYYSNLMTLQEKAAFKTILVEAKAENLEPGKIQQTLRSKWGSNDPDVLVLLEDGRDVFLGNVRDRILNEHAGLVFLNRCPKCNSLAKTPKAKQCPNCYFSWHDDVRDEKLSDHR